jgi:hypothetical protein
MSDDVVGRGESTAHTNDSKTNNAPLPRRSDRWLTPPDRLGSIALRTVWTWHPPRSHQVHHARRWEVNYDPSRFCIARDTGAPVRHASAARAGSLGSGD